MREEQILEVLSSIWRSIEPVVALECPHVKKMKLDLGTFAA
jgi:hypothetical protein